MNEALEANTIISHYRIVSKIGAGGMGEVYLAQDTKLERRVALKILPQEFAADTDRMRRFVLEAKSASALNHPNIITIHEIGEHEHTNFIATEYIEGKTLSRFSALSLATALEVAAQIASALQAAHSAGIVHRDLKPDNVMIRPDGLVKILDFGLAKLSGPPVSPLEATSGADPEAPTALKAGTSTGMIVGTASYMSPEQARGRVIDARSDLFSFGVVLYEMLSGSKPFAGENAMDVIGSIVADEPTPLQKLRPGLPPEIDRIISKALKKNRDERYQTANELLVDLKSLQKRLDFEAELERSSNPDKQVEAQTQIIGAQTKTQTGSHNSIAVLPFSHLSADADNEYFCDGLAEELLNALTKIENLRVAARSSSFSLKGRNINVGEIGRTLNVNTVLEGSVRKSGDRLRISVQLCNAADGYQLWSERYDREIRDIFDVQDEIALAVVAALKLKLFGDEKAAVLKRYTHNPEAYQLYLNGRYHFAKRGKLDLQRAIEYFQEAIKLDPNFALAYVAIADSYNTMPGFGYLSPHEATPHARAAAEKAIDIDPMLAEGHSALASCLATCDFNWAAAEREYTRAIELNPNSALSHFHFSLYYLIPMGLIKEAIREMSRALEIEPFNLIINANLAGMYIFARQHDKALEQARKTYELEPNFLAGQFWLAMAYSVKGQGDEAIAHAEKFLRSNPTNQLLLALAGIIYAEAGHKREAEQIVERFEETAKTQYVSSYYLANVYAALGNKDKAIAELEKAFEKRDFQLGTLNFVPTLDSLRDDPRFQDLVQRMGLPANKTIQTDESLEAKTVMLASEPPWGSMKDEGERMKESRSTISASSFIPHPSSFKKYLLIGWLSLIVLLGGFFGYKYFTPTRLIESIAVLPFVNESGNADLEYLSDGMTETLIASLSQLPNLTVKARSTVFYYKGKEASPKKVGDELNVQAVLLGRVVQRGSDIKLNLELVNTSTQDVIWSEQYNRKQSDLLTLQGEIARDVSSKLKTKLSGAEVAKLTKTYTANPAAYELYLKGKYYANRYTKEGLAQSIDCFNQAIAIDPNYSSAYSGLAYTYILMDDWFMSPNQSAPKAREAARKALQINEGDVDAHVAIALVAHWYDWDWTVAEREFKRSIELNAKNPESYLYYSYLLSPLGRPAEAEAIARQGLQIDPLSSGTNFGVASALVFNRRWDEAIVHLRKAIELDPNYWFHHSYLGRAYEQERMMPEAIAEFKLAFALDNQQSENWAGLAHAYAVSGRKDEAQKMLDDLMRKSSERNYVSPYSVAVIYAGLDDKDKTFASLERAYSDRSYYLPVYLTTDARLDWLHSDPRFKDLVRRIGLPELK